MKLLLQTLTALTICILSGCISQPHHNGTSSTPLHISVLPSGALQVENKTIPRASLIKTLRRAGATPDTTLYIDIPDTLPLSEVSSLTQLIASAGYRRVFYKRPKHANATIQP